MYVGFLTCSFPYWGRISFPHRENSIKMTLLVSLSPLSQLISLHGGKNDFFDCSVCKMKLNILGSAPPPHLGSASLSLSHLRATCLSQACILICSQLCSKPRRIASVPEEETLKFGEVNLNSRECQQVLWSDLNLALQNQSFQQSLTLACISQLIANSVGEPP